MNRPAIPRPAASLVLLRGGASARQVVMGRRASTLRFMPGRYVFPGGAREEADATLACTAIRETFEETGLTIDGVRSLRPIARAVTPEASPIRFDTVFYLAPVAAVAGKPISCGELESVAWHGVDAALRAFPLADITRAVLHEAMRLAEPAWEPGHEPARIRLFRYDGHLMNTAWEIWTPR